MILFDHYKYDSPIKKSPISRAFLMSYLAGFLKYPKITPLTTAANKT